MSNGDSPRDQSGHTRREVLAAFGAVTALPSIRSLPEAMSKDRVESEVLCRPDVFPQPQNSPVTVSGEMVDKSKNPFCNAPVAAYECPFCGARRVPSTLDEKSSVPTRLCPHCATAENVEINPRRPILKYHKIHFPYPPKEGLQTTTVFVPVSLINDWSRFDYHVDIQITGTYREMAPIYHQIGKPLDPLETPNDEIEQIVDYEGWGYSENTFQILANNIKIL